MRPGHHYANKIATHESFAQLWSVTTPIRNIHTLYLRHEWIILSRSWGDACCLTCYTMKYSYAAWTFVLPWVLTGVNVQRWCMFQLVEGKCIGRKLIVICYRYGWSLSLQFVSDFVGVTIPFSMHRPLEAMTWTLKSRSVVVYHAM